MTPVVYWRIQINSSPSSCATKGSNTKAFRTSTSNGTTSTCIRTSTRLISSLTELYRLSINGTYIIYMTINNFHNFDDNSLGKLSSVIFVTMMTVDDLMLTATTTTIDNIGMIGCRRTK